MQFFPASLQTLADQFARLPGIGGKTAQRLAFHVLEMPLEDAQAFAALLGQSDCQSVIGHGLHDSAGQRNVQGDGGLLLTLAVLDKGCAQTHLIRDAILRRVAGHQQVLAKGMAGFGIIIGHCSFLLEVW